MSETPRVKRPTKSKYTILVDRDIQDYQLHLRRDTNAQFSDVIRALVKRVARDKELEAQIFAEIGVGYYDDEDDDAEGEDVPAEESGEFWNSPSPVASGF